MAYIIREIENDSLRQIAIKLVISLIFLSVMEIERKQIPLEHIEKIKDIYDLTEEQIMQFKDSIHKTNECSI